MSYENYDPYFPDQPVVDLYLPMWASLRAFRSKPAFIWVEDDDSSNHSILTYAQLNRSVENISSQLFVSTSLQRGDTVVILSSPGLELVEIIFACQRAGLVSVPIFPPDPFTSSNHHQLVRALSQAKPKAAISSRRYISSISKNMHLTEPFKGLTWISSEELKLATNDPTPNRAIMPYSGCKADDVYLIQYTSGATSIPKPVLVTAGSAAHNVRVARKAYDLHPNSVIVSWLPQYHDCGLMFLLLTIVSGATCVLTSPITFVKRPRIWLEMITDYKATATPVPSFTLPLVVKRGGVDKGIRPINLESMKNLIIINEPIYRASVEQFVEQFKPIGLNPSCVSPSYGLAENCTFVSTASGFPNIPSHNRLLPVARLANATKSPQQDQEEEDIVIMVVNQDTHEAVEDGEEGEIWIRSPSNASGYLGHPFLSNEVFSARLKNTLSGRFVRTGDRGIVKGEERFLFVIGRCSDVVKLQNGKEIHPHYIETSAYKRFPQFLRGGCLASFMTSSSRTIAIVGELQRDEKDIKTLMKICEGIKESVWKEENVDVGIVALVKCASVPKTTSGKVQRWLAKQNFMSGKMEVIMQMTNGSFSSPLETEVEPSRRRGKEKGKKAALSNETEGEDDSVSLFSATPRPSLLSFL